MGDQHPTTPPPLLFVTPPAALMPLLPPTCIRLRTTTSFRKLSKVCDTRAGSSADIVCRLLSKPPGLPCEERRPRWQLFFAGGCLTCVILFVPGTRWRTAIDPHVIESRRELAVPTHRAWRSRLCQLAPMLRSLPDCICSTLHSSTLNVVSCRSFAYT